MGPIHGSFNYPAVENFSNWDIKGSNWDIEGIGDAKSQLKRRRIFTPLYSNNGLP